ncbi:TonB-dependent receptor [Rapidithrix thailandica]|uniref:TonB-dependent receptor n=1 Tax=Rapidithrix thailandica TaxID=413964 RepID=A0AAW9S1E7_9BACT
MKIHLLNLIVNMCRYTLCVWAVQTICATVLFASHPVEGQKLKDIRVQVAQSTMSLAQALKTIESQTQFKFTYLSGELAMQKRISLVSQSQSLELILQSLSDQAQVNFTRINDQIVVKKYHKGKGQNAAVQEKRQVSGTVSDADTGEPVTGASVYVSGTTLGTITDVDGKYKITLPEEAEALVFSFVGYQKKVVTIGEQTIINVALEQDATELEELIVVGYGTQKKVHLTGAVSQIDAKAIENRPISNLTQALQGAVPNLNITFADGRPGSTGNLNVRGNNSITGGSPLVLIDGVPGSLDMINPRDIASVSVLKDAASAAIYGARGAFGVILVTTKNAENGKMKVNYSNNFSWSRSTVSTDFIDNGYDAARMIDEAFLRSTGKTYTGYSDADYEELLKRKTDPSLPSVVVDNRKGKDMYVYYGNTDWWSTMFRDVQPSMEHSLSVSGKSDKIDYYLSGRYYEKKGLMQINQDKYSSYNFRAKINAKVNPWLNLSSNTQFNSSKYTYPGWGVNSNFVYVTVHALPSYLPVNPDGTATYRTELNNYTIGDGIYADLLHGKSKGGENDFEFINTLSATADIAKGLSLVGNYTYHLNPRSTFSRRTEAPWSIYPGEIQFLGKDVLSEAMYRDQYHVFNAYATYVKTMGKHSFSVMGGFNQEMKKYKKINGTRNELLSEDLNAFDLGSGDQVIQGGDSEWAVRGIFYRVNYDFEGKYLLELNGRYDGTSRFPKDRRFGFFPSVSVGWRVSEEAFFEPVQKFVSDLKLRASYGELGNQQVATYSYIPVLSNGTLSYINNGAKMQYLSLPSPVSTNLTWETISSTNVGVDFGFFQNRLTGSFDWYQRDTKDMLTKGKTLPAVFGAGEPKENAADLRTKGWELVLRWENDGQLAGKAFSYSTGFVLSDYTAEITKFDNPSRLLSDYYVGQTLGEIWGYSVDGYFKSDQEAAEYQVDQSRVNKMINSSPGEWGQLRAGDMKFMDLDGDGAVNNGKNTVDDPGDLQVIGNSQPRYAFGITGSASWNGFDLSVFFQGIGRQHWYPGTNADKFWGPYSRPYFSFIPEDFNDKIWSPENPDAYFPRLRGYTALGSDRELGVKNDRYLQDLAYIRLKNLTIGYSLPETVLNKIKLSRCRIYFSGENLFTLTKLDTKYIDPEQAAAESNGRVYPFSKTLSVGLDLSF